MLDVVILTEEQFVNPVKKNTFVDNVLTEDLLISEALKKLNLKIKKVAWSDTSFDWTTTKFVLFRTIWDYAEKFTKFSEWLIQVSTKTNLINDYNTIVWNLDKHYLNDLKHKGVHVVQTYFIESGDKRSLKQIHQMLGWENTVLKPTTSAAAKDTFKLTPKSIADHEKYYKHLINDGSMMLQPFQNSVIDRGEISLMMIGKEYTHAVLKVAKSGDFRVQDDFGGVVHDYIPTKKEIDLAVAAVTACKKIPLYARVDIINDNEGNLAISELELIEPEMWFRKNKRATEMLAQEIKKLLNNHY